MNNSYFFPDDIEQRNIIDRLANFVAKNGHDFEMMTKQKQQGNPMFDFLFGGSYSDYYQHRLSEERMMIDNGHNSNNSINNNNNSDYLENNSSSVVSSYPPDLSVNQYAHGFDFTQTNYFQNYNPVDDMNKRLDELKLSLAKVQEDHYKKLNDSQQNLASESLLINKDRIGKCLKTVDLYRMIKIKDRCVDYEINFDGMENNIQALIVSCTKENICNGKNFVIEHMMKESKSVQCICDYLLARVARSSMFNEKLHVIYFLNDLLHYCKRKTVSNLLQAIESVIVLIYSMCVSVADEDGKSKLNKVLTLWETNGYVKIEILQSMRIANENPAIYIESWEENEINNFKREEDEGILRDINIPIEETISRIFSDAKMKLSNLEANHNQLKYELKIEEENLQIDIYQLERDIKLSESELRKVPREPIHNEYQDYQEEDYSHSLITNYEIPFQMPDLTRPPPGFTLPDMSYQNVEPQFMPPIMQQPHQQPDFEMNQRPERPSIPYWRLPAAVMVAHVKLAQYEYTPIDANAIQLPQLRPPTKRLMDITNTFYQPPSHDRPRDTEGWEKLALHEFYKAKEKAKNGEIADDFVNALHEKQVEDDFLESIPSNERLMDTDYRNMDMLNDMNDFRPQFVDHSLPNPDYNFHHSSHQYGNSSNCSPRMNHNQRSLLGSPWEEYRHQPFNNNPEIPIMRNMNYNSNNRMPPSLLGGPPRNILPKVTPLMSLDISNNFQRRQNPRSKRNSFSRNSENDFSANRNRGNLRYNSRSRSPYDRSASRSRSRSRSSRYSRSRSRSYSRSRSRSHSRSRSQSSRSSRSSDKRPYKGGFIARKSRSRSFSRSRSRSVSPMVQTNLDMNHIPLNKSRNDNYGETSDVMSRNDRFIGIGAHAKEDAYSRFRQRKSFGYSELMKERTEKRKMEDPPEDY